MYKPFLTLALLLTLSFAIEIAVNSVDYRCMVVYSISNQDHLKIDMKFPKITGQDKGEQYSIVLRNTETEQQQDFFIEQGTFRKEIELTEGIVYKLCIKIELNRSGYSQMVQYVEYKTSIKHSVSAEQTKIEIPKSLLKVKDLKQSYESLVSLGQNFQVIKEIKNTTRHQEQALFNEQNQRVKKIQFISFIELAAVLLFGGYQFYSLKGIIESRHK